VYNKLSTSYNVSYAEYRKLSTSYNVNYTADKELFTSYTAYNNYLLRTM